MEKRALKVFICHSSVDKPQVRELHRYLRRRGIKPWLDEVDLVAGQDWQVEIPKALASSDAIIICLTKHSVDKEGFIQKEIKYALDKALEMPEGRIFLIPVRFEECQVPYSLSRYQYVDLFNEAGYSKLMSALKYRADQLERETINDIPKEVKPLPENPPQPSASKAKRPIPLAFIALAGIALAVLLILATINNIPAAPQPTAAVTGTVDATTSLPGPSPSQTTSSEDPTSTTSSLPIEVTDDLGAEMVLVPRGEFIMGSNTGDETVRPAHRVYLDNFYIDKYEVTNTLYAKCVQAGVCGRPFNTIDFDNPDYAEHPVVFIDWQTAFNFCEWRGARLPTEAEWEKAARDSDERAYPWGNEINDTYANYDYNTGHTTPVGTYEPGKSKYGAYDMAGNVWEFVADWYSADYYSNSSSSDPLGPKTGQTRVVRGGAFDRDEYMVRSYVRAEFPHEQTNSSVGFRCAKDINQ